ncbi:MAG TPA: helix-turn-helix transcriptional regulator [Devosia sp.]|nr:helix-turn-helix transcriptional regulator [Devosia sp.]
MSRDQLERARQGLKRITARETEILQATLDGETSKDMARRMHISPRTADVHRLRALGKLDLQGIPDLFRFAAAIDLERSRRPLEFNLMDMQIGGSKEPAQVKLGDILTGICYVPLPQTEDVNVFMTWDRTGTSSGYLMVPRELTDGLRARNMPEPAVTRPLSSALGYGFLLALDYGRQLCLTGDLAVWDEALGPLPRTLPLAHRTLALSRTRSTH